MIHETAYSKRNVKCEIELIVPKLFTYHPLRNGARKISDFFNFPYPLASTPQDDTPCGRFRP